MARRIIKIIVGIISLPCYAMIYETPEERVTRGLAKLDAISAIFVKDCNDLRKPIPPILITIQNYYDQRNYDQEKKSNDRKDSARSLIENSRIS